MLGQLAEPYEVIVRFTYRASRSRAMPETEKPPAMPEDIYFNRLNKICIDVRITINCYDRKKGEEMV